MVPKVSMETLMKFTDNYIKNLQADAGWLEKIEATGLGIRVKPSGNKSWFYRFTFNGKRYKMTLGKYPAITLKDARDMLHEAQNLKEKGINPLEHNREEKAKEKFTVGILVTSWYQNYIEKSRKQPLQIKQQIDSDILPLLGDWELDKLQTRDITKALDKIVNRGSPVHANKILSTLKQAFNYAVSRGEMLINPAATIRARDIGGIEKPRERYLSIDEIKTLWHFLDNDMGKTSFTIRTALKIILLTGVRSSEIRLSKWNEIDFDNSLWTVPAINSKSGLTVKIHLAPLTKILFQQLKLNNPSEYVMPGLKGIAQLTEKATCRAVIRIQDRIGIPHWTTHDLRRTFATQLGETLNVDPVVIEKCLGHKMPKIMATYNKNEMLPQRQEALERWATFISELVNTGVFNLSESREFENSTQI